MAEPKTGTIASFRPEQAFGRVSADDGSGEIPFDATVAHAAHEALVVGAKVVFEKGPSRIPGREKVTRLWLEGSPPPPAPSSAPPAPDKSVRVGPYELLLPPFWGEVKLREKPGFHALNSHAVGGTAFSFHVFLGGARDPSLRPRILAQFLQGHEGAKHAVAPVAIQSVPFECHRFDGSPAVGPNSHVELYVGDAYDDLLVFDLGSTAAWPHEESLRNLLWSIVGGALVRRGYAARPSEG